MGSAGVLLALVTLVELDASMAAFTATTEAFDSSVTAMVVEPPTSVTADMAANILPLLTCRVDLAWTASVTTGIDGYEIIRVVAATGVTNAGPWTTTATSFVDNPVPLQLVGSEFEWRIRTIRGTWRSSWSTAVASNLLACLV